jgi:hypothetical protein
MCGVCVMVAAAGATGARTGLQSLRARWLTPRRLRAATAMIAVAAFGFGSVSVSGSAPAGPAPAHAP